MCGSCGAGVGVIHEDRGGARFSDYPGLRLTVHTGHRKHRHLQAVYCQQDGRLEVSWVKVLAKAQAAKRDGRVKPAVGPACPAAKHMIVLFSFSRR